MRGHPTRRALRRMVAAVAGIGLVGAVTIGAPTLATAKTKATPSPLVKTSYGWLRGVGAGGADRFLGVPFAQPPVKSLRFKAPVAPTKWTGVRD
ncbi:MAG: para-nitrobenzyl esterase, partial [Frankiales bacterium]|nr:para-nitrobenzyl esterase [Frankiales bacterium]